MLPRHRRALYVIFGGAWSTGVLWLVFHYFLRRHGAFGLEPNPLESWWLCLHGAFAFAALWLLGLLWTVHVRPGLRRPGRRRSGVLLFGLLATLVVTGYLLYYAANDTLRNGARWAHWTVGLAAAWVLAVHALHGRSKRSYPSRGPSDTHKRGSPLHLFDTPSREPSRSAPSHGRHPSIG